MAPPRFQRRVTPLFAVNDQEMFTDHGSADKLDLAMEWAKKFQAE